MKAEARVGGLAAARDTRGEGQHTATMGCAGIGQRPVIDAPCPPYQGGERNRGPTALPRLTCAP
jgi:hypothetical protein